MDILSVLSDFVNSKDFLGYVIVGGSILVSVILAVWTATAEANWEAFKKTEAYAKLVSDAQAKADARAQ